MISAQRGEMTGEPRLVVSEMMNGGRRASAPVPWTLTDRRPLHPRGRQRGDASAGRVGSINRPFPHTHVQLHSECAEGKGGGGRKRQPARSLCWGGVSGGGGFCPERGGRRTLNGADSQRVMTCLVATPFGEVNGQQEWPRRVTGPADTAYSDVILQDTELNNSGPENLELRHDRRKVSMDFS